MRSARHGRADGRAQDRPDKRITRAVLLLLKFLPCRSHTYVHDPVRLFPPPTNSILPASSPTSLSPMEYSTSIAATATSVVVRTSCVPAAVFLPSLSSSSFIRPVLRTGRRAFHCRCSSSFAKQDWVSTSSSAVLYRLDDALFMFPEVFQWESGMSMNAIAAAQGIQIRRRFRARYPSEGTGADRAVPRSILEQIVWDKEVEVIQRKARTPLGDVKAAAAPGVAPPPRDFLGALRAACHRNGGVPALIAEVKKASPSKGLLRDHFDPVEIAQAYQKNGAACLSILTDEKHFQGSFENLETVRNSGVNCPLLCKEFVINVWQIYYARSKGADAILLIAAVLPNIDIAYFLRVSKSLGMTALVEVHDERELDRVLNIYGVELIGINNRSLGTFEVDTANTNMLLEKRGDIIKKKRIQVVSESGLFTPDDVAYVQNAGVFAVLVGESLLTQEDPGRAIAGLFGKELLP